MARSAVGSAFFLGALILVATASLSAEPQAQSGARSSPGSPAVTAPRLFESPGKSPYAAIFPTRPGVTFEDRATAAPATPEPKARIVCGMLVFPVTAALDPKIVIAPPRDPKVTYTIRKLTPPVCAAQAGK